MSEQLRVGEAVLGEVIAIKPYGAFVQLPDGETGMIHISEVAEEYVKDIYDYLSIGDRVVVKVIAVNEEGKYNLSLRRLTKQEEEAARYFHQAKEFRRALETRREEIRLEATWRKRAKDKQRSLSTSRASLLNWLKQARRASSHIERKSEERQRFYRSLDL